MDSPYAAKSPETEEGLEQRLAQVQELLRRVPLVDGHNDTPWQFRKRVDNHLDRLDFAGDTSQLDPPMHTDLPRLRAGGVGAQFWALYIPSDVPELEATCAAFEQLDLVHRLVERHAEHLELALTADDVERIHGEGRIASLVGLEGGHSIAGSLGILRRFHAGGVRYLTLTHNDNTRWADSATDAPRHRGLTAFGREVVREMNRLGMMVDLSHVAESVMAQVLDLSAAPVIFSHSSARALTDHPRNVPDEILRRLKANGGLAMVTFVPTFVRRKVFEYQASLEAEQARLTLLYPGTPQRRDEELAAWQRAHPMPRATLADVADHVDHVRRVAGVDHVGLGGDLDGVAHLPQGLGGADRYPRLLAELLRRGWSQQELGKLAGGNLLRVLRKVEDVAATLRRQRPPSDARIEELDG